MNNLDSMGRQSLFRTVRWCPVPIALLLLVIIFPTEFSVSLGSLRLSPYRVLLILLFVPSLVKIITRKDTRIVLPDIFLIFAAFWSMMSLSAIHDIGVAVESGGVRALELLGPYFIARANIRNFNQYWGAISALILLTMILSVIALGESVTGYHAIKEISAKLTGSFFFSDISTRFGLSRAYTFFDHPIQHGVFSASLIGVSYFGVRKIYRNKLARLQLSMIIVSAAASLSSGAMAAISTQFMLIVWRALTKTMANRWKVFLALASSAYVFVDVLSNRSAFVVFLSYFAFSAHTAYNRMIIFEYGIQDVFKNPIFGIGFNLWTRPHWMKSTSMDNYWLVEAVTYGVPSFLAIAVAILLLLGRNWKNITADIKLLRIGWTFSVVGLIIAASTVHFWNNLFVYFYFFIGIGAWFSVGEKSRSASA